MPKFGKVAVLPMILSVVVAATAGAQGAAQCDIDENTGGVAMAFFALSAAQQPGISQPEQTKQLQTAIGRMFGEDQARINSDNAKNPIGRAFTLGKIYMMFLSQPDMPVVTTRGALGFKKDPTASVDLAAGIDSAFKVVEEKAPQCTSLTGTWRQQAGYVKVVQQAMDYANANKVDSADIIARQALTISPTGPYAHLVLGNVAAQRTQNMEAIKHYKNALAEAEKDTVFNDVRRTILYTLGNFAVDAGQIDTVKANQTLFLAEAFAAFDALAKDPGTKYAEVARQGKTMVLRASGDTAAIRSACKEQLDNPAAFTFLALVQCGVTLADIKDVANATKLFEAATVQNPSHRDGLFNLGLMQLENKEFEKAIATTDRLVSVDPSNPDNMKLYVHAWSGIRKRYVDAQAALGKQTNAITGRTAADQAKKKVLTDSVVKMDVLARAAVAKAVDWNTKADSMPVKVIFTEFTPGTDKTTISGEIRNRGATEKSYVLNIEFLDKDGKVVGTGKATVDKVAPNSSGDFSLTGTAPGIVAFRYTPIS